MGIYDNLDKFNLESHGDYWERELGALVSGHFPAYEIFWRRYVVPLTNRIDPDILFSQDINKWIRIRNGVRKELEQMAMRNYSVFYYLGRAIKRVRSGAGEPPEDIFSLLDACGDNALGFSKGMRKILKDFGEHVDFLPVRKDQLCSAGADSRDKNPRGGLVEVQEYRDTILHNPVLGRSIQVSREFLPKREFLEDVKLSWRAAARLRPDQLINSGELYLKLLGETGRFLQETWDTAIGKLDSIRDTDKFRKQWKFEERFLPINPPPIAASTAQTLTASGGAVLPSSPTAVMPVKNVSYT